MNNVSESSERQWAAGYAPPAVASKDSHEARGVILPRLLIGCVVLFCAEVFSGASLRIGLWNPWTLIVTYWLYFAHFFFFTTLAVRTGRTSCGSLYLWGVLFGLYESWITKVIWYGYGGSGKFVIGAIGPFGISELSMAFIYHPIMSFILPLAIATLLFPTLRSYFPELAWVTGTSRASRLFQIYLALSVVPTMVINSGGAVNLLRNLAFMAVVCSVLWMCVRRRAAHLDGRSIVAFGRRGMIGLIVYLMLLYGVTYLYMIPEGRPPVSVQLFTLVFYVFAIVGIMMHRRRQPLPEPAPRVESRKLRLVGVWLGVVLMLALVLSPLAHTPIIGVPVMANFFIWSGLGCLLTCLAWFDGLWERLTPAREVAETR